MCSGSSRSLKRASLFLGLLALLQLLLINNTAIECDPHESQTTTGSNTLINYRVTSSMATQLQRQSTLLDNKTESLDTAGSV